jgi:hypothetical protein
MAPTEVIEPVPALSARERDAKIVAELDEMNDRLGDILDSLPHVGVTYRCLAAAKVAIAQAGNEIHRSHPK